MPTKTEKEFLEDLKVFDPGPLTHIVIKGKGEVPKAGDRALCGYIIKGQFTDGATRECKVCQNHWNKLPGYVKAGINEGIKP